MRDKKKLIRNLLLFVALIALTFTLILREANLSDILGIIKKADVKYIIIAVIFMCIYISCDALNIGRTLKALNEKSSFLKNIKYALIGFFFSAITPAASGGQPMQVYYMHKDNIAIANSSLALIVNLICIQISTITIAILGLFFNREILNGTILGLFIFGVGINMIALSILLLSLFSKKTVEKIIRFTIKVMRFFRLKNIEEKEKRFESELQEYEKSANYMKSNKMLILKTLITTFVQFFVFYGIAYWVYLALGLTQEGVFKITMTQALLYATVSGMPSPGAVGVSEGGFLAIYGTIYPKEVLDSAMLLTRGVNFYLFVIISGAIVILNALKANYWKKK